jgi:very-short-patch-repair endonuclease
MKLYDAKQHQKCKICDLEISHNKQGRFTLHLINEHLLTLEQYLINYFYEAEDLICTFELCNNMVGLRRGSPKRFCSRGCSGKSAPLICIHCGNKFVAKNRQTKTCGSICERIIRSQKTKAWHTRMGNEQKLLHFQGIIEKTSATRRINNTPSWNSGKTGIYSEETIEKIRSATLKQMENQVFRKTSIERIMEQYLIEKLIPYRYSVILEKRQFDFLLTELNVIIECDGDYWHANPKFFPNPHDWQIKRKQIDQQKNMIAQRNGYQLLRFWENDILNNFDEVKNIINDLLATT